MWVSRTRSGNAVLTAAAVTGMSYLAMRNLTQSSRERDDSAWHRQNFRGSTVDLAAGPAAVAGLVSGSVVEGSGIGLSVAAVGGAMVGRIDDHRGRRTQERFDKGLRGHLLALRSGRVSSGVIKIAGLLGVGALTAVVDGRRTRSDILLDAACIAGTANVVNLLDLRPGRAAKAVVGTAGIARCFGAPTSAILGAAIGTLPIELAERSMLGDAGANAMGAALGRSLVRGSPRVVRLALLGGITGLTLASERVSFSAVIDRHPVLHRVDQLGRRR